MVAFLRSCGDGRVGVAPRRVRGAAAAAVLWTIAAAAAIAADSPADDDGAAATPAPFPLALAARPRRLPRRSRACPPWRSPRTPRPARNGEIDLTVEIDRGDVWYDFPYDGRGRPIEQRRDHYPHLMMFARWNGQKIRCALAHDIGSWRSEVHPDGASI